MDSSFDRYSTLVTAIADYGEMRPVVRNVLYVQFGSLYV